MHGKFGFFKGGHACPIILLVVVLIILAITSVVTSTDTKPTNYYGKHIDEDGNTTVQLRRGQSYIDGEIIPAASKTTGITPLAVK